MRYYRFKKLEVHIFFSSDCSKYFVKTFLIFEIKFKTTKDIFSKTYRKNETNIISYFFVCININVFLTQKNRGLYLHVLKK